MENMHSLLPLKLAGANLVATGVGADASLAYAVSPAKREMLAVVNAFASVGDVASDTFTLALKLQESPTTADTDFADITGATFTDLTDVAPTLHEAIYFETLPASKYIREAHTLTGGTGTYGSAVAMTAFVIKRRA